MTRSTCYYEILGVSETAGSDEIKKAYRSLALVWHPDKNQTNPEAAHAKFQTILKAYETLSDSKERDWYDRHKDQILSDGDESQPGSGLNLFQYFSSSCYANFDDSEDGFYTVYRKIFEEIANEEEKALKQASKFSKSKNGDKSSLSGGEPSFPCFGNSKSKYEDTVRPFYAFWSGFCTNLTFDHLDKYNTTEAENRRILRAMEKENRKLKDQAKKERNSTVRNLVEFIKKRDKRLKAHKLAVEQQNELNRLKTAEKQKQQRVKTQKQFAEYKPSAWEDMNDIEAQLQKLENEYDAQERVHYDDDDTDDEDEDEEDCSGSGDEHHEKEDTDDTLSPSELINPDQDKTTATGATNRAQNDADDEDEPEFTCHACNKSFRTIGGLTNHEASKKHKQCVAKLTKLLEADEARLRDRH